MFSISKNAQNPPGSFKKNIGGWDTSNSEIVGIPRTSVAPVGGLAEGQTFGSGKKPAFWIRIVGRSPSLLEPAGFLGKKEGGAGVPAFLPA